MDTSAGLISMLSIGGIAGTGVAKVCMVVAMAIVSDIVGSVSVSFTMDVRAGTLFNAGECIMVVADVAAGVLIDVLTRTFNGAVLDTKV